MIKMNTKKENRILPQKANVNPFRVPEGYFDMLPQRIMNQVGTEHATKKEMHLIRFLHPSFGLVAGFAIILALGFFSYWILKPDSSSIYKSAPFDEEYFISYSMDDQNIYETLESENPETPLDNKQLENVILGSVNEYELIVLNDQL
jgi:hypothetical protein